jgi:hypothetical protein
MSLTVNQFGEMLFADLLPVNILSVTEDKYLPAIQNFMASEQAYLNSLSAILCDTGTEVQTGFLTGVGGQMQRMTKKGSVEATRGGVRWWVAFPLYAFGTKQIYEVPWLQRAKFVDLAASIYDAVLSDIRTTFTEMLGALFNNVNATYDDTQWPGMNAQFVGQASGPLTITRLANADSAVGSVYARGVETQLASLNHYLTSGGANPTVGNFTTVRDKLRTVGNDSDIAIAASRATCDYVVDNFTPGTDFVQPVEILERYVAQDPLGKYSTQVEGLLDSGVRSRGRVRNMQLLEFQHFPDNYLLGFDRSKEPPLRKRISDLASEQGLYLASDDDMPDVQTHPLARKQWRRIQGFGARNRANGVVMQITAGSYTVPTIP